MCSYPVFSATFIEEAVFAPLYILASFVKTKVLIAAWFFFWTFYLVPLVYVFVLFQCHTVLMTAALQYRPKSRKLIPPAPFFFLKTALAIRDLLCFHVNCEIFCSSSVKNAIGNLIGIALNLQIALGSIFICTTLSLPIQEHHIFFLLFVSSFDLFHQCLTLFCVQFFCLLQFSSVQSLSRV